MLRYLPNTITCMNLLSGSLAVIATFHLTNTEAVIWGIAPLKWVWILIGAAAVFDFCDGLAARALHAYSAIGKELDSLSDLVSFGLAPGMLMFNIMLMQGAGAWSLTALFLPVMGALRLAKFNVDDRQATSFLGLPIPANAIFWIGVSAWISRYGFLPIWVMIVLILGLGLLMVCNLPMFSLKFKNLSLQDNVRRFGLLLGTLAFVIFVGISGLAWAIILYLILSLLPQKQA